MIFYPFYSTKLNLIIAFTKFKEKNKFCQYAPKLGV